MRDGPTIEDFANRLMLLHMRTRGGLGHELQPCRNVTKRLIKEFAAYILDGDELATPREFCRVWVIEIEKVSPVRAELIRLLKEHDGGNDPFPKRYAQGIDPTKEMSF